MKRPTRARTSKRSSDHDADHQEYLDALTADLIPEDGPPDDGLDQDPWRDDWAEAS